jgi:hypothetical protein
VTLQQSFVTPGAVTINSVDIKFYSGESCAGSNVFTKTLNGSAENPVIPAAGTYTSTNTSNNALCGSYAHGTTTSAGCSGLYADMGSGNMRSMQYSYNVQNSQGIISQIVGACMYNPSVTIGSTTGVEGVANWNIPQACTGGTCGFSQAYSVDLTPPLVPNITVTPTATWQTVMGSAYAFTASITDGSSTMTPTIAGITGAAISPASCDLDSTATASCTFIVTPYYSGTNYSFWNPVNVANSTDVATPTTINTNSGITLQVSATIVPPSMVILHRRLLTV